MGFHRADLRFRYRFFQRNEMHKYFILKLEFSKDEIRYINEKMIQGCISTQELKSIGFHCDKIEALLYLLSPRYAISTYLKPNMEVIRLDEEDVKRINKCSMCHKNFRAGLEVFSFTCVHLSHERCIQKRIRKHESCPVCNQKYEKYPKLIQKWINTDVESMTFLYKIQHRVSGLICVV